MVLSMLDISCDTYFAKVKYVFDLTLVWVMKFTSSYLYHIYRFTYYDTLSYGMLSVYFILHIFVLYHVYIKITLHTIFIILCYFFRFSESFEASLYLKELYCVQHCWTTQFAPFTNCLLLGLTILQMNTPQPNTFDKHTETIWDPCRIRGA
jgi:hypothetical protein